MVVLYLGNAALLLNGCATGPLRIDPLKNATQPPVVDEHLEVAQRYAPIIVHETHREKGRQDIPAPFDFDGDLNGENNWDHFPEYELVPTVYYSVLETETHWFIAYHLFHPRDWTGFDLGVHLTHENDGENLQVVVDKASQRPVLLFTQAHFKGEVYGTKGFKAGSQPITHRMVINVERPVVFVESHGHGIYGRTPQDFWGPEAGAPPVRGIEYRLASAERPAVEPEPTAYFAFYRLESLPAKLWDGLRSGSIVGEGKLLDGAVPYEDERVHIGVPRYYEADRYSGPLGSDRGISPFALDFGFSAPHLGSLYFDPARRYAEVLTVPEPWSLEYIDYPFMTKQ